MKRSWPKHLTAAFAVSALLVSGCGSKADTAIDTSNIKPVTAGTLTACSDMPYQPFEFQENGVNKGIDVDLVTAIADQLKYKTVFKETDFDGIFDALDRGDCDIVASSVSITDERKQKYLFSDGYFEINQSLLVRSADAGKYTSLAPLSGHKIGVQTDTTGADYAKAKATGATVQSFDSTDDMFNALSKSEIDAIVQDFPVNSYLAQKNAGYKVTSTFTDVDREQYGFAMKMGNTALQTAVNKSLGQLRTDGKYDAILGTYLGTAAS